MNIGIRLHDTVQGTLDERMDSARAQGFTCIQLAMQKSVEGFSMLEADRLLTKELADEVREALKRHGLEVAVLGCYLKLADFDEETAEKTRRIYEAHLRFAGWIGARCVGTETPPAPSAGEVGASCQKEETYQIFLKRVRPIVRCAEEEGVDLAIEPVCSHVIYSAALTERLLNDLNSDRVKVILDAVNLIDSRHVPMAQQIVEDAIQRLGAKTTVMHLKDFVPVPDAPRPKAVACGLGQMQYGPLLRLAKERELPITLENTTPENAEACRLYLEDLAAKR